MPKILQSGCAVSCFLQQCMREIQLVRILAVICFCHLLDFIHPLGYKIVSPWGFTLHFPHDKECWSPFHVFLVFHISSYVVSIQVFWLFYWITLIIDLRIYLCNLNTSPLAHTCIVNTFHSMPCIFIFSVFCFHKQEF